MANADIPFSGSIPELYTRYMGPVFFEPYAQELARRVAATESADILETACGTGIVTRALRRALPAAAAITATDLNPPMLDYARTLPGGERVRWQQADAQTLPFPDAGFDAVVCSFGAMFFPDKPRAYREALRVLRPGGRFLFSVWSTLESSELVSLAHHTVAALFPQNPPNFMLRMPHGYHDTAAIRADLAHAGCEEPMIETLDLVSRAKTARDIATGIVRGTPLSVEILARDPAGLDRAAEAVTETITARFGTGSIEVPMQAHVVTVQRGAPGH